MLKARLCSFVPMLLWLALSSASRSALALDSTASDPREILRAALDPAGDRSVARMRMTTKEGSDVRERTLITRTMRFAGGRKTLILIEQPADVRNTGFLTIDYNAQGKADEQWLYLPALHRVTRVPSSGKSDPFVGSDFSIADLTHKDADDYSLKMIDSAAKVGDEDCWLIETVPKNENMKQESGYTKSQVWVSKSKHVVLQSKLFAIDASKTKYFKATEVRMVDGTWTPHRLQMRTLDNGKLTSETVIELESIKNNASDVVESEFTQQRLERGI